MPDGWVDGPNKREDGRRAELNPTLGPGDKNPQLFTRLQVKGCGQSSWGVKSPN